MNLFLSLPILLAIIGTILFFVKKTMASKKDNKNNPENW